MFVKLHILNMFSSLRCCVCTHLPHSRAAWVVAHGALGPQYTGHSGRGARGARAHGALGHTGHLGRSARGARAHVALGSRRTGQVFPCRFPVQHTHRGPSSRCHSINKLLMVPNKTTLGYCVNFMLHSSSALLLQKQD